MSLIDSLTRRPMIQFLRDRNPHLSQQSAAYMVDVILPITQIEDDPEKAAVMANEVLLSRVRHGDRDATRAVTEDLKKFRPVYEKAVKDGADAVVALALAFPWGEAVARQHVEMFKLIDGTEK